MSTLKRETVGEENERTAKVAKRGDDDSPNAIETPCDSTAGNPDSAVEMEQRMRLLKSENKMMQSQLEAATRLIDRDEEDRKIREGTFPEPQRTSVQGDSQKQSYILDKVLSDQKSLKPPGDELTTAKQELKSSNKTVNLLSDSLEEARAEVKTLRESAASSKTIVSGLIEEKQQLSSSNRHLQEELERTTREMNEAKEEIRSSERTISLLSNSLERARNEIASMKVNSIKLAESLQASQQELGSLKEKGAASHSNITYVKVPPQSQVSTSPELGSFQSSTVSSSSFLQNPTSTSRHSALSAGAVSTMIFCNKQFMGRIIGSKGTVVNGIQSRSGTVIHINQDVLPGADCEITVSGSQEGVDAAKQMIQQIVENCSRAAANSSYHKSSYSSAAQHHNIAAQQPIPSQTTRIAGNDLLAGHQQHHQHGRSSLVSNLHLPPQQLSSSNSVASSSSGNSTRAVNGQQGTSGYQGLSGDQHSRWSSM